MPGYRLIEMSNLKPHRTRGIMPAENTIGLLDFLRELEEEPFSLPRMSKWQVVGLEEVLYGARPREEEIAIEIRSFLNRAASLLDKKLLDVQVILSGEVIRGADLASKYRGHLLPIHLIFNHPTRETDSNGNPFYPMTFHLSSP